MVPKHQLTVPSTLLALATNIPTYKDTKIHTLTALTNELFLQNGSINVQRFPLWKRTLRRRGCGMNRPFPSSKKFHFQNEAKCETSVVEMSFNYDANKTHFHNKGFALSLVLKVKLFGTRKWPIVNVEDLTTRENGITYDNTLRWLL